MAKKKLSLHEAIKKRVEEEKKASAQKQFSVASLCFEPQHKFISDPNRFKVATCSRRAGKTVGIALSMIDTCLKEEAVICLYTTLTSKSARAIIWGDIKRLLEQYKIDCKIDETRLTVKFLKTKSEIRLGGAKDESEIEKYRGWKIRKAFVDEAQSFRPYLTYFINDILMPALRDLRGDLSVTGTPGPLLSGPFYEMSHSQKWSQHHWTAFDNIHMKDLHRTLAEEREVKGITEDDPGYIRETYGKWVQDIDSLVYKFNPEKNIYQSLPESKFEYIFGIDIGYEDADAIAVIGYNDANQTSYLVEEKITAKQTITDLVNQITYLQEKYKPVKMVMDAGALGKKIQEEIRMRHSLHIEAAEKHRKFEFIELLNDDLRTAKFKAKLGSRFQEDCSLVQWDKSIAGKLKISESYHTDIGDAVLYAWRESKHYFKKDVSASALGTDAYMAAMEQREAEEMERRIQSSKSADLVNSYEDLGINENDDYGDIY